MRRAIAVIGAAAMPLLLAAPAWAHVTANPNQGPADGFFRTAFRVGHGCEGSPTVEVTVRIPPGVVSVSPEQKPGWEAETVVGELAEPIELHGEEITEGVQEVTWRAVDEPLPDELFTEFGVSMRLPAEADGDALWFPFVQRCEEGAHRWVEIPESVEQWGELEEPAPYVQLAAEEDDPADEPMSADEVADLAAARVGAADDGVSDALVYAALALGALGTLIGVAALVRAGRA